MSKYVIGVDFGTESGRVVIVDIRNGDVIGIDETLYKDGVIQNNLPYSQLTLPKESAIQNPYDYLEVLKNSIPKALIKAEVSNEDIVGIGIDFTASTILPVNKEFVPLCFFNKWKKRHHAWVKLWKNHTSFNQAERITKLAIQEEQSWIENYGGKVSSEWMLPKVLEVLEDDIEIFNNTAYFVEALDWINATITGKFKRSNCALGFKGLWNEENGYLDRKFLKKIHPKLEHIYEDKLSGEIINVGEKIGGLTKEFATEIGLKEGTPVSAGIIDAHAGVPGAGVVEPGKLVMIMGTSSCHITLSEKKVHIEGISGMVKNSIVEELYSYEAGQAAVGDIFSWYIKNMIPPYIIKQAREKELSVFDYLEYLAEMVPIGSNGVLSIDWHNGSRTPFVDSNLSGVFIGLTLSTKPEDLYRSLIESTAYGARLIVEKFIDKGIDIKEIVACGGLPLKNKLLMQIYADVLGRPIKVINSTMTPALGASMYGAVAAFQDSKKYGYQNIKEAAKKMSESYGDFFVYEPNDDNYKIYTDFYNKYRKLTTYFNKIDLMRELKTEKLEI